MAKLKGIFTAKEGGKTVVRRRPCLVLAVLSAVLVGITVLLVEIRSGRETSRLPPPSSTDGAGRGSARKGLGKPPKGVGTGREPEPQAAARKALRKPRDVKYGAPQVILREKSTGFGGEAAVVGASGTGRLLDGIDMRNPGVSVRVRLTYAIAGKDGKQAIPKGSIFIGGVSGGGKGKVFLGFNRVVFPDGRQFAAAAQALDPRDFTSGLRGTFHSNRGLKVASKLGLTMVGGISGALAEKQAVGYYGTTNVKSTLKDATLHGLSLAAREESRRQARGIEEEANDEYTTVEEGTVLIVSLTEDFKQKES